MADDFLDFDPHRRDELTDISVDFNHMEVELFGCNGRPDRPLEIIAITNSLEVEIGLDWPFSFVIDGCIPKNSDAY